MESNVGLSKSLSSGLRSTKTSMTDGDVQLGGAWHQFLPETRAYLNQLTSMPSMWWCNALDILIRTLIIDNNWGYLDRMWIFATEVQQHAQVSIVNPNGINAAWPTNTTEVNSPSWKILQGYTGNGTSSYVNTNNTYSGQSNFSQNNGAYGIYFRTNNPQSAANEMGCSDATNINALALNRNPGRGASVNVAIAVSITKYTSTALGILSGVRTSSANELAYVNGSNIGTTTQASNGVPTTNVYVCAFNSNGSTTSFSTNQISMAYWGSGSINQVTFYNAFQTFATTIGFNV